MAGCAPRWDWREFTVAGTQLQVAMPCRPDKQSREIRLTGQSVVLTLHACSEQGVTFAIAWADVQDPAKVGAALSELESAAVANLGASVLSRSVAQVPGSTPQAAAHHLQLQGRRPDGVSLVSQVLVFAHGTKVFQATALGEQLAPAQVQPMLDALRVKVAP